MKNFNSPILVVLILLCLALPIVVNAGNMRGNDDDSSGGFIKVDSLLPDDGFRPIVVVRIPSNGERDLLPISAAYVSGTIEFDFYSNIGTLYTVVTNESTGERWSEYIDTADGFYTMNIATQYYQGVYSVTMNTENNITYGGSFSL